MAQDERIMVDTDEPAEQPADQRDDGQSEVTDPGGMIRIGTMLQALINEVHEISVDEPGRHRLHEIHRSAISSIREIVSEDLRDEIEELSLPLPGDGTPSEAELRIAQAQLLGWLDGVLRGLQAAVFSQQLAQRQQQALQQGGQPPEDGSARRGGHPGSYL